MTAEEIAALQRRLRELSIVLTDHLGGGSEWFSPLGDAFYVDPKAIKVELQRRKTDAQITKRALVRANARSGIDAADAARYRWLRDHSAPPHNFYISVPDEFHGVKYGPDEVDAYIDDARAILESNHDKA